MKPVRPKFNRALMAFTYFLAFASAFTIFVMALGAPFEEFFWSAFVTGFGALLVFARACDIYADDMYTFRREFERYYGISYYEYEEELLRRKGYKFKKDDLTEDSIVSAVKYSKEVQASTPQPQPTGTGIEYRDGPLSYYDIIQRGKYDVKIYVPSIGGWSQIQLDEDGGRVFCWTANRACSIGNAVLTGAYDHE